MVKKTQCSNAVSNKNYYCSFFTAQCIRNTILCIPRLPLHRHLYIQLHADSHNMIKYNIIPASLKARWSNDVMIIILVSILNNNNYYYYLIVVLHFHEEERDTESNTLVECRGLLNQTHWWTAKWINPESHVYSLSEITIILHNVQGLSRRVTGVVGSGCLFGYSGQSQFHVIHT